MTYSKEDWAALMSSEVFREYYSSALSKEAQAVHEETLLKRQIFEKFQDLQKQINASPELKEAFKALQEKFATDEEYTKQVDPKFVAGVLTLKLDK